MISQSAWAEKKQLQYYEHFERKTFPTGSVFYADSLSQHTTHYLKSSVLPRFQSNIPLTLDNQSFQYWIKIPYVPENNISDNVICISNPHINVLRAWWLDKNLHVIDSTKVMGDDFAFNQREYLYPPYFIDFPENTTDSIYLILLVDKRNEQFLASVHKITKSEMQNWTQSYSSLFGWLLGIIGAIFLINLFLAFQVREKIYVFYSLFLFFVCVYIIADFGMFQAWLSYDEPFKSDGFRPIAMACTAPLYVLFFMQVLNIKSLFPKFYTITTYFNYAVITYILCTAPFFQQITHSPYKYTILNIAYFSQIITIVLLFIISAMAMIKKTPFSEIFTLSVVIFLMTHVVNFFHHNGTLDDRMYWTHFLPICYALDCILMGGIVAQKFIQYQGKSKQLLIDIQNKDKEISDKMSEIKESDLSRISQFLHDNIGAEISALRLHIEKLTGEQTDPTKKEQWQQIVERTGKIADEIRKTSHQLSPTMLQRFGLTQSIGHYISDINSTGKIHIQFDFQGDCDKIQQRKSILILQIIQETTQNTIKHAKAKNMIVQLFYDESKKIHLVMEDDGIGFDTEKTPFGLGLTQLEQIIHLSNGKFNVVSKTNEGTTINIELTDF